MRVQHEKHGPYRAKLLFFLHAVRYVEIEIFFCSRSFLGSCDVKSHKETNYYTKWTVVTAEFKLWCKKQEEPRERSVATEINIQEDLEDKLTVMGLKESVGQVWEIWREENIPGTIWGILWKGLFCHSYPLNTYCVLHSLGGTMGEAAGNITSSL